MSDSFERLHNDLRTHFERYASIYPAYGERFAIHSVLIHPQTRRKCLVLWYIESPLAEYAVAAYVKTEHFKSRKAPLPVEPNRAVNYPLQHLFRRDEGEVSLSEAQTQDLMDVAYAGARYLTWKKGDVLIVDNIAAAHGRMPCQSARRLVAGYWNEEDVRQYSTYPELADDCPSTMAANASRSPEYVKRVMSDLKAGKFKM
jgi:hypothetical protein